MAVHGASGQSRALEETLRCPLSSQLGSCISETLAPSSVVAAADNRKQNRGLCALLIFTSCRNDAKREEEEEEEEVSQLELIRGGAEVGLEPHRVW